MPAELRPIEPPSNHPTALRAFAVTQDGQSIGTIAHVHSKRPNGASHRNDWYADLPAEDTSPPFKRPWDTRRAAVEALQFRYHKRMTPPPAPAPDHTLTSIQAAREEAGAAAALWLAAAVTVHHLTELEAARRVNPASLWNEIHRIIQWLDAATKDKPDDVHYRLTRKRRQLTR
mgnify:FL=1